MLRRLRENIDIVEVSSKPSSFQMNQKDENISPISSNNDADDDDDDEIIIT